MYDSRCFFRPCDSGNQLACSVALAVIKEVAMTNTLPLPENKQISKIKVLSVAQIIASALDAVFEDTSVSEIFGGKHLS